MNIEEMSKKVTIFYNEDFIVEMVCEGIADSEICNKVVVNKDKLNVDIRELIGSTIYFDSNLNPTFILKEVK